MNCEEIEELIGAYALGALPREDVREIEKHLGSCEKHEALAELRAVAQSLMLAAPDAEPPSSLKTRLMAEVRGDSSGVPEQPSHVGIAGWLRRVLFERPVYAAGAALAVAIAVIALVVALQSGGGQPKVVEAVLQGTPGETGRVVYVPSEHTVAITAEGLPALPPDKTYQIWALMNGSPTSIGFLEGDPEQEAFGSDNIDLNRADTIAITVEPAGGSPGPTTDPILAAKL